MGKLSQLRLRDTDFDDRARELTLRAQKLRRKGELRRAAVTLREACAIDEQSAVRWVLFGDLLFHLGKRDEASHALKQALFLRERQGDKSRANVIRRLILNLARPSHR